ncbi:MAG TPA: helix-turn-helix domain-containing protein [Bacilli bacterium]
MDETLFENVEGTFSISYRKAQSHHMPLSHFHSTYEIHYLMSGQREFFIKDRTMVIREGDVVVISPNILHRTTNAAVSRHERLVVNIHEDLFASVCRSSADILRPLYDNEYVVLRCSPYDRLSVDKLARDIVQEIQDKKFGFESFAQILVIQMIMLCFRNLRQANHEMLESPSPMHERISEVARYMNRHYMEPLTLQLTAEKFFVSPYYLSRFFKEATGFTFVEYLHSVRVKEAKKLLEHTSLKAGLIAKKVGFGSVTHFGRVFKTITGHSPLYYRKSGMKR